MRENATSSSLFLRLNPNRVICVRLYWTFGAQPDIECSWMRETSIDWIFQGPSCAVLIINLIFLLRIMWVSRLTDRVAQAASAFIAALNRRFEI